MMVRAAKAACVAALMTSVPAWAGEAQWRISQMSGPVRIERAGLQGVAVANRDLKDGDTIVTGKGGRAVLVRGRQYMTVTPDSRIAVYAPPRPGGFTRVIQSLGSALFNVDKRADKHFRVETPQLAAVVKGTTFTVTTTASASSVQVTEGAVEVATLDGGARSLVTPGMIGMIDGANPFALTVLGKERRTIESPNRPVTTPAAPTTSADAAPAASNADIVSTSAPAAPESRDASSLAGVALAAADPAIAIAIVSRSANAATRAVEERSEAPAPQTPPDTEPAPPRDTPPADPVIVPDAGGGDDAGPDESDPAPGGDDGGALPDDDGNNGHGNDDDGDDDGNPGHGGGGDDGDNSGPGNGESQEADRLALEAERTALEQERAAIEAGEGSGSSRWQQIIDLIRAIGDRIAALGDQDDDQPGMGGGDDDDDDGGKGGNDDNDDDGGKDDDDDDDGKSDGGKGGDDDDDDDDGGKSGGGKSDDDDDDDDDGNSGDGNSGDGKGDDDDDDDDGKSGGGKGGDDDDDDDDAGSDSKIAKGEMDDPEPALPAASLIDGKVLLSNGMVLPGSLWGTRMLDNLLRSLGLDSD